MNFLGVSAQSGTCLVLMLLMHRSLRGLVQASKGADDGCGVWRQRGGGSAGDELDGWNLQDVQVERLAPLAHIAS
eukprot:SAG11_NODE_1662_length_4497_cov_2.281492_3_plen_75_part_00